MPAIPDGLKAAGLILEMQRRILSGLADGGGTTILNQKKRPLPGNKPASTPTGKESDDEDEVFDPDEAVAAYRRGVVARAAERAETFSGAYDPKNYCDERYQAEERECYKRTHEYADMSFLNGCIANPVLAGDNSARQSSPPQQAGGLPDSGNPAQSWTGNNPQTPLFDPTKPPPPFDPSNYYAPFASDSIGEWIRSLAGDDRADPTRFVPPIFSPLYRR
jgi:hypothetical protein